MSLAGCHTIRFGAFENGMDIGPTETEARQSDYQISHHIKQGGAGKSYGRRRTHLFTQALRGPPCRADDQEAAFTGSFKFL